MAVNNRNKIKQWALSGVFCALACVMMLLGGIFPLATFACPMLACVCLIPVDYECGTRLAVIAYAVVSTLSVLLVPEKETALVFVFFGYYPIVKKYIDKLNFFILRALIKFVCFNASIAVMYSLIIFVFKFEAVSNEFRQTGTVLLIATLVLANITFVLFDILLKRFVLIYAVKIRKIFFK